MVNIKNLDPNKSKTDESSCKNVIIFYVGYVTSNSAKLVYLIINKTNGYVEKIMEINIWRNEKRLGSTEESKDTLKKDEELCNKIRDLIRSINNDRDN